MDARCTSFFFFFQAEDGIRDGHVTGVQTCALPILIGPKQPHALSFPHPGKGGRFVWFDLSPVPRPPVVAWKRAGNSADKDRKAMPKLQLQPIFFCLTLWLLATPPCSLAQQVSAYDQAA